MLTYRWVKQEAVSVFFENPASSLFWSRLMFCFVFHEEGSTKEISEDYNVWEKVDFPLI